MGNCWGPRKTPQANKLIAPAPPPTTATGGTKHGHGGDGAVHGHGTVHSTTTSSSLHQNIPVPSERCKPVTHLPTPRSNGHHDALSSPHLKDFTYNDLRHATRNFKTILGEGGFGFVYKGWIDRQSHGVPKPGGTTIVVAVKKLKPQGFQGHKEWLSEVNYLGQLRHPHLVKLIGYCLDGDSRLLVYEYMPKGSLENHLFSRNARPLPWAIRIKVAIGAARGLSFLHSLEQQVIYRDFKASNVLLDSEFHAKLSDFGLAKAGPTGDRTHVSTQVLGTQGYAAPEYIATGHLTVKCDIYSFGVVLLELLSGRPAVDKSRVRVEQSLVDWAKPCLGDPRKLMRVMDIKLEGQYPKKGAFMVALLALECLADAKYRPSMGEVLDRLKKVPVPAPKEQPHSEQQHYHHHHQEQTEKEHHHHHHNQGQTEKEHHHHHHQEQTGKEKEAQSMSIPRPKSPLPSPSTTTTSSSSSPLSSEIVPLAPNSRRR